MVPSMRDGALRLIKDGADSNEFDRCGASTHTGTAVERGRDLEIKNVLLGLEFTLRSRR
jgi:hypothetical protein